MLGQYKTGLSEKQWLSLPLDLRRRWWDETDFGQLKPSDSLLSAIKGDKMKTVPEALESLGALYRERNLTYGDNYKLHGAMMKAMFPNGITLRTPDDHNRFGVFTMIAAKLLRYANMWERGGHADSLDDLTVYTQMLRELDAIIAKDDEIPF